jgi:purine nucleosidase
MTAPLDLLIDTDTASDDAVALIMALRNPAVAVRGITTVAGNVGVGQATANALFVAELCGATGVPVHAGCGRPMLRPAVDANWFHGRDGLSDLGFAPRHLAPAAGHAVDAILDLTHRYPGLTLVTLGPLTNVAVALLRDPALAGRVGRCVVMGGNPCCVGNVTPAAEYNVWCDPEAAEVVLRSGMAIDLVGWHLCRGDAALDANDIARARAIGTPLADFAIDCNRTAAAAYRAQTGEVGISLPDPTAMAVAIDPAGIIRSATSHPVRVECQSELTRGQTVVDQLDVAADARNAATWSDAAASAPARVVWSIDVPAFKRQLFAALA